MPRAYSRPMNPPTEAQAAVHRFMLDHQQAVGKPPTFREIEAAFGFASPNGVACHLKALAKKGLVAVGPKGESRRFRAVEPASRPSPVDELTLELCAFKLNEARWKDSDEWRRVGDRVKDGQGGVYDADDANAIVYYLDHGRKGGRS